MSEIPSLISTHRPSPSSTSPAISFTLKCLSNFDSKSYITSILTVTALLSLYCVPSEPFLQLKHPSSLHAHPSLRHTSLPSPPLSPPKASQAPFPLHTSSTPHSHFSPPRPPFFKPPRLPHPPPFYLSLHNSHISQAPPPPFSAPSPIGHR